MRFAVDTGGTFTDLVVESDDGGSLGFFKAPTVPEDPVQGVLDAFAVAAAELGIDREKLLESGRLLVHATTRALNAVLTDNTARTALLITEGHRDVLLFREGGRTRPFDHDVPYPNPYIPRSLTFEVTERIGADGQVVVPLDPKQLTQVVAELGQVEAVAVCLLWSVVNPEHELAVGRELTKQWPELPVTLSHELNPTLREYRRASSAAIDASLKPLMDDYLNGLQKRLAEAGFDGQVVMPTSAGGLRPLEEISAAPIHALKSGPSMAPVAGRYYADQDVDARSAIVADTGGTSYDVSLVRDGRLPWTRETWLGERAYGHITGFPSVDVVSVGAGGGSIAAVDKHGMLHVGPQSAGADPGPACYGKGGTDATLTDACVALGYLDPQFFLGGAMSLEVETAREAIASYVAEPLDISVEEAAASVVELATERMVRAALEITVGQGVDPQQSILVGGGGAAGLNSAEVARLLGCRLALFPPVGAVLSAAGALISDLSSEFAVVYPTSTAQFDHAGVSMVLKTLSERSAAFADRYGGSAGQTEVAFIAEARYRSQSWDIPVDLPADGIDGEQSMKKFVDNFHHEHRALFGYDDPDSPIEISTWHARVILGEENGQAAHGRSASSDAQAKERQIYFAGHGWTTVPVSSLGNVPVDGSELPGPAIIDSPVTTIVVPPGFIAQGLQSGSIIVRPRETLNS